MLRELRLLIGGFVFIFVTFFVILQSSLAEEKLQVSGYGNTHYMDHSGTADFVGKNSLNNGFFQIREFSLFLDFTLTDTIIASTELEAGDSGNLYTANYAYISIQATDTINIRAGKILVPFLSYNENKPNFTQFLMSQPFTAFNIAPVIGTPILNHGFGWSDAGAVVDLCCLGTEAGFLNLKLGVMNGLGSDSTVLDDNTVQLAGGAATPTVRPRDGLLQNEETTELTDNNNNKAVVAKLTFMAMTLPFDIGASWYQGKWDNASSKNLEMIGGHLNWLEKNWSLKGEYVTAKVEQDAGFDPLAGTGITGPAAINTTTGDYTMLAWYAEISYVVARYSAEKYLRLIARYDDVDTNDKARFTPWDRSRITGGMEFQVARNARIRYEWQRSKIDDFQLAPTPFINAGGKEKINMNMASLIFSF